MGERSHDSPPRIKSSPQNSKNRAAANAPTTSPPPPTPMIRARLAARITCSRESGLEFIDQAKFGSESWQSVPYTTSRFLMHTEKHLITFQLQAKLRKRDLPQRSQSTQSFFFHTLHLCAQCLGREIPGNLLKPRKRFRIATLKHKEYFEGFPIPAHFILISTGERNLSCGKKRFVSEPPRNVKFYAAGMKPLALRNSLTNASKPAGSSMQQA